MEGKEKWKMWFFPWAFPLWFFPATLGSANLENNVLGICIYKIKLNQGKAGAQLGRQSERRAPCTAGHLQQRRVSGIFLLTAF